MAKTTRRRGCRPVALHRQPAARVIPVFLVEASHLGIRGGLADDFQHWTRRGVSTQGGALNRVAGEGQAKWDRLAGRTRALAVRYPSNATALVCLAMAEAKRGSTAEARRAYAAVLERVPNHIEAGAFLVASSK